VLEAIVKAGFVIVATHPIKAEMSVAKPKLQAKEPIDLDIIIVCRKRGPNTETADSKTIIRNATREATEQIARFNGAGRSLSRNDVYVILMSLVIKRLSWQPFLHENVNFLDSSHTSIERAISDLHGGQRIADQPKSKQTKQMTLW
jgi:putative DNA methylase